MITPLPSPHTPGLLLRNPGLPEVQIKALTDNIVCEEREEEKRIFLNGPQLESHQYPLALAFINTLLTELRWLNNKMIPTEVHFLDSCMYCGMGNVPRPSGEVLVRLRVTEIWVEEGFQVVCDCVVVHVVGGVSRQEPDYKSANDDDGVGNSLKYAGADRSDVRIDGLWILVGSGRAGGQDNTVVVMLSLHKNG
ncbi:hypothetical protein CVT25_007878 [Psilocybe cyanescens]|uniref:Uncharacterized protein n=1 Tax=Psilocybe cyanescens TaxID=93625 RepID=A0A409XQY3_PSICY|nr:hypothetical protein CVT25_007878 [Psilocybe cyanescens]